MNKLFKAYVKLIDSFHSYYSDLNNEIYKNAEYQIDKILKKSKKVLNEKSFDLEVLTSKNKEYESEISKYILELSILNSNHLKLRKDYLLLK